MKRVILLGSSGSIGASACKVARALPAEMKLVGLAVNSSTGENRMSPSELGFKGSIFGAMFDAKDDLGQVPL